MIAHSAPRDLRKTWRFNTSDEPGLDAGGLAGLIFVDGDHGLPAAVALAHEEETALAVAHLFAPHRQRASN